jgi:hypothetical protein
LIRLGSVSLTSIVKNWLHGMYVPSSQEPFAPFSSERYTPPSLPL